MDCTGNNEISDLIDGGLCEQEYLAEKAKLSNELEMLCRTYFILNFKTKDLEDNILKSLKKLEDTQI